MTRTSGATRERRAVSFLLVSGHAERDDEERPEKCRIVVTPPAPAPLVGARQGAPSGCTRAECHDRDTRCVAHENDSSAAASYAPVMTDRTRKEHPVKRIVAISAVVAGLAVPSVAGAGNDVQVAPQVTRQVVESQLVRSQLVRNQLVRSQRISSQRAQALRFSWQIGLVRR